MARLNLVLVLLFLASACSDTSSPGDTSGDLGDFPKGDATADVPSMPDTPDVTEPDLEDTTSPEPDISGPDVKPDFGHCSEPGGARNIYDLQDPQCPDHISPEPQGQNGVDVVLEGVIVTGLFGDTMFVAEGAGGPYSGIAVYTHGLPHTDLSVGTIIDLEGSYSEFYECSQVYAEAWTVVGQGQAPAPYVAENAQHLSTNGVIAEMFEGVLVQVLDVETTHTIPDCPQDYGEFEVSGGLRVDDKAFKWEARLGDKFTSITGVLHYEFSNFKVEPRDEADVKWTEKGGENAISKCIADECQAPDAAAGTKQIVVTEVMADPSGSDYGQEWVELYNPGNESVSVDGWEIRDCGAQALPLIGANLIIEPGGFLVVGANKNPATNGGAPVDYGYGEAFYLPNTVGSVLIYDASEPFGKLVDQMRYSRFEPWESFKTGASLERIDPVGDGTVHTNWATGTKEYGIGFNKGTPGKTNSATP